VADSGDAWWVVCLCAEWCGVCREWQPLFAQAARLHSSFHFAWVDIEDEAEALGDVDIETFPTILVARGNDVFFMGPIPPTATQFTRLLATLTAQAQPSGAVPPHAAGLLARLKARVLPHARV
jgi:thioredoxin 1